jgi:hypothetical protein
MRLGVFNVLLKSGTHVQFHGRAITTEKTRSHATAWKLFGMITFTFGMLCSELRDRRMI